MTNRGAARSAAGVLRAATAAFLLAGWVSPLVALAADSPPDPDTACAKEKSFKSTAGVTRATLTIINNTDQPVQSYWLDYTGKRVLYEKLAAHKQYKQPTWLTHPWIVASLKGTCYRLHVMTALEQTVTVNPGTSGAIATAGPVVTEAPIATTSAGPIATAAPIPTAAPVQTVAPFATVAPLTDPGISSGTGANPPDYTLPLVLGAGALAAVGAAVAAYWAGHTHVQEYTDTELNYTGRYYDQYGRPIADEQVAAYEAAVAAWEDVGSTGAPPQPPMGNPYLPKDEQILKQEADRRALLMSDSEPAMFIKDTDGNFYDPSGRAISKAQMDAFWKGYDAWDAGGHPFPTVPTGDPNKPINDDIVKSEAERRARAADEQDPAYIEVPFTKP